MANSAKSVLSIARSQLGLTDGTKYGKWYGSKVGNASLGAIGVPWCAMFVSWCFDQAGASCAGLPGSYCPTIWQQAKIKGKTLAASDAKVGDVVLFDWDGGNPDHIGIVEAHSGGTITTIEGNVSGKVARKYRTHGDVKAIVRPDYAVEAGKAATVTAALKVDGVFGIVTCKALQTKLQSLGYYRGYAVDGIFGTVTKKEYQRYLAKLGYYDRVIDGVFGTYSVMAEQRRLTALGFYNRAIDGARGYYTKVALQQALNAGKL